MNITLATLPFASEQEVFDQVKDHLLKQNKRSMCESDVGRDICAYRGRDGMKCAAGCLIGDEEYKPSFEDGGAWDDLVANGIVPDTHKALIRALQVVHDVRLPDEWKERLKMVAGRFHLKYE